MAKTQISTLTEDELSAVLAGNVDSIITPQEPVEQEDKEEKKATPEDINDEPILTEFTWDEISKLAAGEKKEGEEEVVEEEKKESSETKVEEKKSIPGRKPTDLATMVNEMVIAGELIGFEEGEVKTIEDAKELIKLNNKHNRDSSKDEFKQELLASYSPQIQAIIHYAEQGGHDVRPLISAIAEVEKTSDFNLETEKGQEDIIKEYLKVQGWDEEDIKEEIDTIKDLDKLKTKAEKFLPKLSQMTQERVELIMAEQEEKERQIKETRQTYLNTIHETLKQEKLGEVKLQKQEKGKLWNAVADISYKSFNGTPTNAFYKKLEDLQVGKQADYTHFLELVYLAVDREGYKEKLKEELKATLSATTAKKLKVQESKAVTGSIIFDDDNRKPVIKRGFKNPWD